MASPERCARGLLALQKINTHRGRKAFIDKGFVVRYMDTLLCFLDQARNVLQTAAICWYRLCVFRGRRSQQRLAVADYTTSGVAL